MCAEIVVVVIARAGRQKKGVGEAALVLDVVSVLAAVECRTARGNHLLVLQVDSIDERRCYRRLETARVLEAADRPVGLEGARRPT